VQAAGWVKPLPLPTGHGQWENMAETISIVDLRCRFGGSRAYFICPVEVPQARQGETLVQARAKALIRFPLASVSASVQT